MLEEKSVLVHVDGLGQLSEPWSILHIFVYGNFRMCIYIYTRISTFKS